MKVHHSGTWGTVCDDFWPPTQPKACAGSWTAGRASEPWGMATLGRVWGASSWMMCGAGAVSPH